MHLKEGSVLEINTALANDKNIVTTTTLPDTRPSSPSISSSQEGRRRRLSALLGALSAYPSAHIERPVASPSSTSLVFDNSARQYSQLSLDAGNMPARGSDLQGPTGLGRVATNSTEGSGGSQQAGRVRVVGRGGSGSRPRGLSTSISRGSSTSLKHTLATASAPPPSLTSDPGAVASQVRFVGRGGSGSKQRKPKEKGGVRVERSSSSTTSANLNADRIREGPSNPPKPHTKLVTQVSFNPEAKMVRLPGRGGAASRPRVIPEGLGSNAGTNGSTIGGIKLPWKKSKKAKGKEKEKTFVTPTSRPTGYHLERRLSTESTASTIRSSEQDSTISTEDMDLDSITSPPTRSDLGRSRSSPSISHRSPGNVSKIARTMGELPPHLIYQNLVNQRYPSPPVLKLDTHNFGSTSGGLSLSKSTSIAANTHSGTSSSKKDLKSSPQGKNEDSVSLGSLSPSSLTASASVFRSAPKGSKATTSSLTDAGASKPSRSGVGGDRRGSVAISQRTVSTCGDLHRFYADDVESDSWGEVQDDRYYGDDNESPSSESPITFSPPTPVAGRPPGGLQHGMRGMYRLSGMSDQSSIGADSFMFSVIGPGLRDASHAAYDDSVEGGHEQGARVEAREGEDEGEDEAELRTPVQTWPDSAQTLTEIVMNQRETKTPASPKVLAFASPLAPSLDSLPLVPETVLEEDEYCDDASLEEAVHQVHMLSNHLDKPSLTSMPLSSSSSDVPSTRSIRSKEAPFGQYDRDDAASTKSSTADTTSSGASGRRRWSDVYDDNVLIIASSRVSSRNDGSVSAPPVWSGEWNKGLPTAIKALRML